MSAKHQTPEYQRNAKVIRRRVAATHRRGEPAICWRCGGPIPPGMAYDVGHRAGAAGSSLHDLAPEHRSAIGACPGNRSVGAAEGARIRHARRQRPTYDGQVTQWHV